MKTTIPNSAEITAMVTGYGLNGSYLHRFKIILNSTCPCRLKDEQTINHKILNCTQTESERRRLQHAIVRKGYPWPPPFEQLTRQHIKIFTKFITAIDLSKL
jgi:hypothetical protein